MVEAKPAAELPIGSGVRHFILGTAGHIDHGKTSLIEALTGTNTDRLPEEKRRGMTIELGFATMTIGDRVFGIVDVPGHERFVKTMVAGATGVDLALIVVAADDSVMPQTVEHVEILTLLRVSKAVVAVTKIDLVDADMVELVTEEVRALLSATPFREAPICGVSSVSGQGIAELREAIALAAHDLDPQTRERPFRMAIDRVFTVAGRGMVVTGSVLRGRVAVGEVLALLPADVRCRVRGLQSHNHAMDELARGQRAAINLIGLDREEVRRGQELATPDYLEPGRILDIRLTCAASETRPIKSSSVVRLGMGTSEVPVRVVLLKQRRLEPGESGLAQLRSGVPVVAVYGQRFILRDAGATRTIGGGVVLAPNTRRRRLAASVESLHRLESQDSTIRMEEVLRSARFEPLTDLHVVARVGVELADVPALYERLRAAGRWNPIPDTAVHATPSAVDDLLDRLTAWLERHHQRNPDAPGCKADTVIGWLERMTGKALAKPLLDAAIKRNNVRTVGPFICLPAFAPALSAADERLLESMIRKIEQGGFQPPTLDAIGAEESVDRKRFERLATLAVATGRLVRIDATMYLHPDAEAKLRASVRELIARHGAVTVASVREAIGSTRKYVVPFMEYLDRIGFTKRVGDERVLAEATAT